MDLKSFQNLGVLGSHPVRFSHCHMAARMGRDYKLCARSKHNVCNYKYYKYKC